MNYSILTLALCALTAGSVQAQGYIRFANTSTTTVRTNLVPAGTVTALTGAINPQYRFAML